MTMGWVLTLAALAWLVYELGWGIEGAPYGR